MRGETVRVSTSPVAAFRHMDYRWYWASGLGMVGAQNTQRLAMSWLVLELTGSLAQLGLMIFMMGLPMVITSLWGGVLADRYDKRWILFLSQAFTGINLGILAVLTMAELVVPWHLYVSSIGLGVMQAITMPARQAMIQGMVPVQDMRNAVALNTIQQQAAQVVFPSIAGFMIALAGIGETLALSSACAFLGIAFLFMVRSGYRSSRRLEGNPLQQLVEGMRYSFREPRVGVLMSMGLCAGFFGLYFTHVAPGFAREVLSFEASEAGLFMMSMGIGSITGSFVMLTVTIRDNLRFYLVSAGFLGTSLLLLGLAPWVGFAFLGAAGFGFCISSMIVSGQTLLQMEVPQELLGRTTSVWSIAGGIGLGASLPVGALGELFGLRFVVGGTGLLLLLCSLGIRRMLSRRVSTGAAATVPNARIV